MGQFGRAVTKRYGYIVFGGLNSDFVTKVLQSVTKCIRCRLGIKKCYMLHGDMRGWVGFFPTLPVTWGRGGCRVTVTWNCAFFSIVTRYEFRLVQV